IFTQVPCLRDLRHFPSREKTRHSVESLKDKHLLFCGVVCAFPTLGGTIFFYQKSVLIESFHQKV
ncbi:TPA: hypothetical protein ACRX21_006123, partial [Klebsiella pneumoniae]